MIMGKKTYLIILIMWILISSGVSAYVILSDKESKLDKLRSEIASDLAASMAENDLNSTEDN